MKKLLKAGWRGSLSLTVFLTLSMWISFANAFVISTCNAGPPLCTLGTPTEGWDGPGLGSVTIPYYVGNPFQTNNGLPGGITLSAFDTAISSAMGIWSSVVQVSFNKVNDATSGLDPFDPANFPNPMVVLYSANNPPGVDHGDGNPFDGPWNPNTGTGNVLAHAFGPPDISGGSGNVHLDGNESWVTSGAPSVTGGPPFPLPFDIDLVSILLHELGHSLGLNHIDDNLNLDRGIVMQPGYFGPLTTLHTDDIVGIQSLYCPSGQVCGAINGAPEPATFLLLGSGLLGLSFFRRKKMA